MLVFSGCGGAVDQTDIAKINGYWEIEKVVMPDGEDKDFGMNMTFDYFEIKGNKGFRKKGAPRFDGKFETNDILEDIEITTADNKTMINYSTPYATWSEQLVSISDDKMVVINAEKKEYHYKRTGPINLLEDGEETK